MKSTDVAASSAAKPAADMMEPDHSLMRSRKSLSLDNLQTAVDDNLTTDPTDFQSQSVMYARNMNQSFRVAVDKSFDGPSLAATLAG